MKKAAAMKEGSSVTGRFNGHDNVLVGILIASPAMAGLGLP
jgi:hypothetical protein